MSSYALGAIQMMTPSTFRRRNITGRGKSINSQQNRISKKQLHSKNKRCSLEPFSMPCPPNTLSFEKNTSGSSCNFALSQLTMSQLSDSISHHRAAVNQNISMSNRPSKVPRTSRSHSHPSAQITINLKS